MLRVLGTVHKRRPQSGGLSSADILQTRGLSEFFRYGLPHFLEQKNLDFSKCMVCPHGQRGLSLYGHFADKGREG